MSQKGRKNCSKYDIFKILDAIEILQHNKSGREVLYVPKKSYRIAKKMLKIEGKGKNVKIKTY